jgi:hypothetical protein
MASHEVDLDVARGYPGMTRRPMCENRDSAADPQVPKVMSIWPPVTFEEFASPMVETYPPVAGHDHAVRTMDATATFRA